ncbi:MAG: FecR domain-containing protein [Rhodocyclaceae bacterium]|nr:FecR domain-containing protein [Rhodocyclaceae bacterium]
MEQAAPRQDSKGTGGALSKQAAAWFLRLNDPACTDEDRRRFDAWLGASERHAEEYRAFRRLWQRLDGLGEDGPVRRRRAVGIVGFLAACALLLGIVFAGPRPAAPEQTIATATGEIRRVTLADGSIIDVNADSRIAVSVSDDARRIRVERGEAVFVVADDSRRPFEVLAGAGILRDIGTTFGVAVENGLVSVSVIEGAVEVRLPETGAKATVGGGERLAFSRSAISPPERFDGEAATAWRFGRFEFRDTPLHEVVHQINRHHARPTELADPSLGRLRVSGAFSIADRHGLLTALEALYPIRRDERGEATRLARAER